MVTQLTPQTIAEGPPSGIEYTSTDLDVISANCTDGICVVTYAIDGRRPMILKAIPNVWK